MRNRLQYLKFALAGMVLLTMAGRAHAEHFEIQLTVSTSADDKTTSFSDTYTAARPQGFKARPVCHAKVGDELVLQFFLSSNFPHEVIKNVMVRFFVIPEVKAGQDAVPSTDNAITRGHFVMDFKPTTGKVGLREHLKLEKPGAYLVRVESDNSDSDHEHFSALDLIVE